MLSTCYAVQLAKVATSGTSVAYLKGLLDLDSNVLNAQKQECHYTADGRREPLAGGPEAQRDQAQPDHQKLGCVPESQCTKSV